MAYIDENLALCDKCCESCRISAIGAKIDTLIADITSDPQVAYSGDQLEDSEILLLNSMCEMGNRTGLGTLLDDILTASETYTEVAEMSDATKNLLNSGCEAFHINEIGTKLQSAILTVNSMAEYDEANMLTFAIHGVTGATGTIGADTITVNVPYNTTVTNLVADFTVSDGAVVTVSDVEQTSGSSTQDYTSPVAFVVTSQTGDVTKTYTATITILPNTASDFLTFVLAGANGVIDTDLNTIAVETPFGTNLTSLAPTFTVSDQGTVFVGSSEQTSAVTLQDFSNPIVYRVVAGDESYTDFTVSATVAAE